MGTCLTYVPLFAVGVFLGGIRWKTIIILALAGTLAAPLVWNYGLKGYQKERILTVFNPERDPSGTGYQVRQSRIAIGSGGLWGKGLSSGTQSRLQFLPQQHTDFVFSALSEQGGFAAAATVLALYALLVMRAFSTGRKARDRLGLYLAVLIGTVIGFQALINLGMALGALPTIGVPLPLLSYGGSSMLATMTAIGLLTNIRNRRFVN
jgi:rod shape determining protein RodA